MIVVTLREQLKVDVIGYDLNHKPQQKEENVELTFTYFDKEKKKQTKTFVFPEDCRYGIEYFFFAPLTKITFQDEASLDLFLNENNISEKLMWY